ncbi:odorant receptor 10a isoform X2 [Nilaparvata lugens]|nr:odorant receptor 10a isoform X2 [Nilaparvata lugens]
MMVEIISHFQVLNHSILIIEERTLAMYNTFKPLDKDSPSTSQLMDMEDSLYDRCYSECLRKNIFHHKALLDFVDLFQDVHSTLFGVLLGANMLVIAAITIVITKVEMSMETSKFYFMMFIELVNVFIYCLLGTLITEEAKRVGETIYCTPWTSASNKNRGIVKFIQLRVTHDVVLKGNGLFSLSLQLYIQIMQTSYSIFNLFNSVDT